MTKEQRKAVAAIAEQAHGLLTRARGLVADGMSPIEDTDVACREADPKVLVAAAYVGLLAALMTPPAEGARTARLD
jgi:hypothetical protein